jgi:hypothetical protein
MVSMNSWICTAASSDKLQGLSHTPNGQGYCGRFITVPLAHGVAWSWLVAQRHPDRAIGLVKKELNPMEMKST